MARTPIHPGEILADELEEIGLTAKKLADMLGVPPNRLYKAEHDGRYGSAPGSVFRHVGRFLDEPPERL
jgi:hypothetical protein